MKPAAWSGVAYAEGVKSGNPRTSPSLKVPSVPPSGRGFRLQKNPRTRLDVPRQHDGGLSAGLMVMSMGFHENQDSNYVGETIGRLAPP